MNEALKHNLTVAFAIAVSLGLSIQFVKIGTITDERNALAVKFNALSASYEAHLADEYAKNVCNVIMSGPRLTDRTEKDDACIVGVRQRAKTEVAAAAK